MPRICWFISSNYVDAKLFLELFILVLFVYIMVGYMSFRLIWYQLHERRASHEDISASLRYISLTINDEEEKSRPSQLTIITPVTLCLLLFFHSRLFCNPTQGYPLYHLPSQPTETSVASPFQKGNFILLTERKKKKTERAPPSSPLRPLPVFQFPPASKRTLLLLPYPLLCLTVTKNCWNKRNPKGVMASSRYSTKSYRRGVGGDEGYVATNELVDPETLYTKQNQIGRNFSLPCSYFLRFLCS
ncbi:hypothetical protein L873DRAFT_318084 [Choiromyces venosus 120613-1]|uniref:Uncharacterized protein n=1 Tax=Choiromyces venosus 120613-1 TaxID=1336337 RepID=A0A3N4J403_9PEZI|nr:hypothetical protein L873DRAFT_318084 [Choiromyces venosus 120613-1]